MTNNVKKQGVYYHAWTGDHKVALNKIHIGKKIPEWQNPDLYEMKIIDFILVEPDFDKELRLGMASGFEVFKTFDEAVKYLQDKTGFERKDFILTIFHGFSMTNVVKAYRKKN